MNVINSYRAAAGAVYDFLTGLVLLLQFEGDTTDSTGNHTPTLNGSITYPGSLTGTGGKLPGTTDYLTIPNSADFDIGTAGAEDIKISIGFDFKFNEVGKADGHWVINKRGNTTQRVFQIYVFNDKMTFQLFSTATGDPWKKIEYDVSSLVVGTWYHWDFTYNGNKKLSGMKMYFQGAEVGTGSESHAADLEMENFTNDLVVGTRAWVPATGEVKGVLDQLYWITGRNLTPAEILHKKEQTDLGVDVFA